MKKLLILLFVLLATPAAAQWQVSTGCLPIGRGAGITGFLSGCAVGFSETNPADLTGNNFSWAGFGGTWKAMQQFNSSSTLTHNGTGYATFGAARTATGSGTDGPANADYAGWFTTAKLNYLSSSVEGEIDGIYVNTFQGNKGTSGAINGSAQKVRGGAGPTGGAVGAELAGIWLDTSGNTLMNVHAISGFAESAGAQSGNTGYGFYTEHWGATQAVAANIVQPFSAFYGGAFDFYTDCPTHCPTFTNLMIGSGSRTSAGDIFFKIGMGLNQTGDITVGSGNANGADGNPTQSGGTRWTVKNVSGDWRLYANNGTTNTATITQIGNATFGGNFVALGNATFGTNGSALGTIGLKGSTSGQANIQPQAVAGTPTLTLGTNSGTPAVTATAPLAIDAPTGNISITSPLPIANGGTAQTTAAAARAASGLNVESATGHGDSIYTIQNTDRFVYTNAAFTGAHTWTLPAANTLNPGQQVCFSDLAGTLSNTNILTISRAGADTIDGATSFTVSSANAGFCIWSDGTSKWASGAFTSETAWTSYTPGVSCVSGTITTLGTHTGSWKQIGKSTFFSVRADITTNGTCAGGVVINLPTTANSAASGAGRENAVTGKMLQLQITAGSNTATFFTYDNLYPGGTGTSLLASGVYESQ